MPSTLAPETSSIKRVFEEEIAIAGGTVPDVFDDGGRLFLRSILPPSEEVHRGDRIHGGVALRTRGADVLIHPYFYRVVCKNGAIMAQAIESRCVQRLDFEVYPGAGDEVLEQIVEAVRACTDEKLLASTTSKMRSMTDRDADHVISLAQHLATMPKPAAATFMSAILAQYNRGADRSTFGLMNAVTAVARDAPDPEDRWRLEEAGGGMLAVLTPAPAPTDTAAALALV